MDQGTEQGARFLDGDMDQAACAAKDGGTGTSPDSEKGREVCGKQLEPMGEQSELRRITVVERKFAGHAQTANIAAGVTPGCENGGGTAQADFGGAIAGVCRRGGVAKIRLSPASGTASEDDEE